MTLYGKSIDAATSTGPGTAFFVDAPKTQVSLQVTFNGSPTSVIVKIELTLDGVTWGVPHNAFNSAGNPSVGDVTGLILPPFVGFRANLTTLSGGTAPDVTVWVGAA